MQATLGAARYVRAAEQVDHIIRPRGDHKLQVDPQNFQSLCADHHQEKSLWERRDDGRPPNRCAPQTRDAAE